MSWQNRKIRLRDDSSWQRASPTPSRLKTRTPKPQGDVNDDGEEVYCDGTSITNITVLGVKDKIAMFGTGAKPGVANKPVLARFQQNLEQNNVNQVSSKSNEPNKGAPALKTFGTPTAKSSGPLSPKTVGSPTSKTFGTPAVKTFGTPASNSFGTKVPPTAVKPKTTPTSPTSPVSNKTETTDINKNITTGKRGSLSIPGAFLQNSNGRKISVEEKPVQNGHGKEVPTSPVPSEASVTKADDEPDPKHNLRANLRPVQPGSKAPKAIDIDHPRQRRPSQDDQAVLPPGVKNADKPKPATLPKRVTPGKIAIVRKDDGKKFEKLAKSVAITTELPPIKPLKPKDISKDLKEIIDQFKKAYDDFKYANEELYDDVGNFIRDEPEEEYDDIANVVESRTSRRISGRPVSAIEAMSAEEEFGSGGSASASGSGGSAAMSAPIEDDTYDDGIPEELYEPLDEIEQNYSGGSSVEDKKEQLRKEKEEIERRKKIEKEKKETEKREKAEQARTLKEQKAQLEKEKKKEKEEKELRKKLKITGDEQAEAQGVVKEKAKGGKLDLAVEAGERLDIIRMTDTPKGKWVVKNKYGAFGYVDMKNINIETATIKKAGRNV